MLKQDILSVHAALGNMLGRLDVESAEVVRQCRRNLTATAEQADELESRLLVPDIPHEEITA